MFKTEKFLRFEENPEKNPGKSGKKSGKKCYHFKFKKLTINCVKKYGSD